jgi:hypothetical protein
VRLRALEDGAVPGTNLGTDFTSSISEKSISPEDGENYLDEFILSYKGDIAAASNVTIEDFLDLVNTFRYKADTPRIELRGRDIFALSVAWFGNLPWFREGATAEDVKVGGMRIPVQSLLTGNKAHAYRIGRSAVTNISGEVLRLTMKTLEVPPPGMPGRIDAKEMVLTTPASAGIQTLVEELPRIGRLLGLLVFLTTVPTDTADAATIQRLFLETNRGRFADAHVMDLLAGFTEYYAEIPAGNAQDVLGNYGWLELRQEPINLVDDKVSIKADVRQTSEAMRIVPVIEVAQGG